MQPGRPLLVSERREGSSLVGRGEPDAVGCFPAAGSGKPTALSPLEQVEQGSVCEPPEPYS